MQPRMRHDATHLYVDIGLLEKKTTPNLTPELTSKLTPNLIFFPSTIAGGKA